MDETLGEGAENWRRGKEEKVWGRGGCKIRAQNFLLT